MRNNRTGNIFRIIAGAYLAYLGVQLVTQTIQQKPTNYITMFWINTDGRGVIRNISQKQNYAQC